MGTGRYVSSELTSIYTGNDRRVGEVLYALEKYTKDRQNVRAIGFCVSMEHAKFMAEKFCLAGLRADFLTSENVQNRSAVRRKLVQKEINYLFVVDIFNEGLDIPEIDTVLFLRPTESLTIFLQQLGRGLRLAENKDCLTVLDFVGNSRPEYVFENKFRALIGKTATTVSKEIEDNFPHLPLGCSIILEKKAKQIILENIKQATTLNRVQIIQKIQHFQHQTTLDLNLKNFVEFYNIPLQKVYRRGCWMRLCQEAGILEFYEDTNERKILQAISKRWLSCTSVSYFQFIFKLAKKDFAISIGDYSELERLMLLMIHYDVWQDAGGFESLEMSIREVGRNKVLVKEIEELMEILIDRIDYKELDISLPFEQPLKVHARYTRNQILAAFGLSSFDRKYPSQEGVAYNARINTELLFINLIKSEENFSPTTMYDDYAIDEFLFHWQSQNSAGPDTPKGISYLKHRESNKRILLFVREKAKDEFGNSMGYVFIGEGSLRESYGSKPMNIKWELSEPIPHYLWKDAAKLRIG